MKSFLIAVAVIMSLQPLARGQEAPDAAALSIGMADIPSGVCTMGNDATKFWDQKPAHRVDIAHPFRISTTEITLAQYRRFRPEWSLASPDGFVWGVSWYDAAAFCEWISRAEGKPYRLPTEVEWEYVDRSAAAWGVQNMHNDVREWCYDWYGPYAPGNAVDPVGAASGLARVVRGGVLDIQDGKFEPWPRSEYELPAYRAGMPPAFGFNVNGPQVTMADNADLPGAHHIGFRVVQGAMPTTAATIGQTPFVEEGIRKTTPAAQVGPDPTKPYFRKRHLLPSPPDKITKEGGNMQYQKCIDAAGLDPSFRAHNHSPALEVCDNGDLLLVLFTSYTEYEPEMTLMSSRLRFGADAWDMPSPLIDCPGACDNTPLLWKDQGRIYLIWAWSRAIGAYPFQWRVSEDNGATWSETRFPSFSGVIGPHSRQPITRAFRAADGTIYVPSDAVGGSSVLWASRDNMETWFDTGGRSAGRHTAYCELKDGRILGLGGKNTEIDGYMPEALSSDGGKTWETRKTSFPALGNNQRPSLIRLQSGRLFYAGDFQKIRGVRPPGATESGSFVALSDDEGETWRIKKLSGAQEHEGGPEFFGGLPGATTLGYSVARQAPNGVIHLITTMNKPCLHFEMNEAWILSDQPDPQSDPELMANTARHVGHVKKFTERYPDGKAKYVWRAGTGDDGRYLLHGTETWHYPDGTRQYQAHYRLGCKTGSETLWRADGARQWEWKHAKNGVSSWTQWWENGVKKAESTWQNFQAIGVARTWNRAGELVSEMDMPTE